MTWTKFERISKYFHVNDTSNNPPRGWPGHDKLCHIRPVIEKVAETMTPPKEQSIDEGMIAFKRRLSLKQYLPAKLTKFGIKVWERASPKNSHVHEFQIYTGRVAGGKPEEGLGSRVIKDLSRNLEGKNHVVYMDNFFSSPELFQQMLPKQIYCCGTVHLNLKRYARSYKSS